MILNFISEKTQGFILNITDGTYSSTRPKMFIRQICFLYIEQKDEYQYVEVFFMKLLSSSIISLYYNCLSFSGTCNVIFETLLMLFSCGSLNDDPFLTLLNICTCRERSMHISIIRLVNNLFTK